MRRVTAGLLVVVACAVGVVIGLLAGHEFAADWFEAVGVWVGALGTVGAIVWAVRSFQIEQAQQRANTLEAFRRKLADEELRAALLTAKAKPGSTSNGLIGSAMVDLTNSSATAATDLAVVFHGQRVPIAPPAIVQPHSTVSLRFQVPPFKIEGHATGFDADLTELVIIEYDLDGVRWQRSGRGVAHRLTSDEGG